jgi:hypothetical protein
MTFVKCQKCGVFLEYESKSWALKNAKPICYRCLDIQRNQENDVIQTDQEEKDEKRT